METDAKEVLTSKQIAEVSREGAKRMSECICKPEWEGTCPVHGWGTEHLRKELVHSEYLRQREQAAQAAALEAAALALEKRRGMRLDGHDDTSNHDKGFATGCDMTVFYGAADIRALVKPDQRTAFAAALDAARLPWRELLWLNHARYLSYEHGPYGDDGEMQCCGIDFKRWSTEEISEHLRVRASRETKEQGR